MFNEISDWIFHRALRLSAATVTKLAAKTKQDPARIRAVNNAVAGIAAHEAVQAAQAAAASAAAKVRL
jgi:hypothetical protein